MEASSKLKSVCQAKRLPQMFALTKPETQGHFKRQVISSGKERKDQHTKFLALLPNYIKL